MDSREYLLKYGDKALQFYRRSIQKSVSPTQSDAMSEVQSAAINAQEHMKPIEHPSKPEGYKRLTLDQKKPSLLKIHGHDKKKGLTRSKSKVHLKEIEALAGGGLSGVPTTRKPSKESRLRKSNSQLHIKQSQTKMAVRPSSRFARSREDIDNQIKTSLEIRDMDSFVRDVLNNINLLMASESTVGKWLGYFKLCFERLYAVSEEYIRKYASAAEEISRLRHQLETFKERDFEVNQLQARLNQSHNEQMISGLTRKLERFEQREKILLSTLEFLKNEGDPKDTSLSESLKGEARKTYLKAEQMQSSQGVKHQKPKPIQASPLYI